MRKKMSGFSLNTFAAPTGDWYKNVGYEDAKSIIKEKMISSAENYVAIGYYLKHIWEKQQYKEAGYSSIWECAKMEFGYSQGRASRYIDICEKYSVDGDSPYLDERFKAFNKSQLQELLSVKDEKLIEQVSPDMSVKEIRAIKNAAASEKNDLLHGQMTIEGEFREFVVNNDGNSPKEQELMDGEQLNVKTEKKEDIIEAAVFKKSEVIEADAEDDETKMPAYNDENVERAVELVFDDMAIAPKASNADNIYTDAEITRGSGDTEGNDTVIIKFAGCYGEFYGTELTEREIKIFKAGVLSERERVWNRLADILDEETLQKIGYEELNGEGKVDGI